MQQIRVKLLFVVDENNPSHYIIKILSTCFASKLSNSSIIEPVPKKWAFKLPMSNCNHTSRALKQYCIFLWLDYGLTAYSVCETVLNRFWRGSVQLQSSCECSVSLQTLSYSKPAALVLLYMALNCPFHCSLSWAFIYQALLFSPLR